MEEKNFFIEKRIKFKKIVIFILGVAFLVFVGFYGYSWYQSYSSSRESWVNYEQYKKAEKEYIEAMTADTYGGKTPEETLNLFIEALKNEDVELASKYFALETNSQDPDYLTRKKWEEGLRKAKEEGKIVEIVSILLKAKPAGSVMEDYFGFEVRDESGELIVDINMKFNSYSKVWKIESL